MAVSSIGQRAWHDLGGRSELLDLVADPDPPIGLPSRLDVSGLLADSVALVTTALHELLRVRGQVDGPVPVVLAGDRIATSAQSERHLLVDGEAINPWSPLSGFWQTADGWVRTHGNSPHHADRLLRLLGLDADPSQERVAEALAGWSALELEEAGAAAGAIVGAVRRREEWMRHPHAAAVAQQPLITADRSEDAAPRGWVGGGAPLAGVRVLDLTRVIAGPTATRDLAFAGADVLRVDSPHLAEIETQHLDTGQGKRSTRLDLGATADRRVLEELLSSADVVVSGYRPGALDRFGLSPEALHERHPGIVTGTVSAWGPVGPWSGKRGFDSIVQAVTGIAVTESQDGERPGALPAQALDHSAGHFLAAAVVHGLVRQRQEGGSATCAVSLVRIAHELLEAPPGPGYSTSPPPATVQTANVGQQRITCAAPVLVYPGAPQEYPELARPWGADPADWS